MPAGAKPSVFFAGCPTAERAADAWVGRTLAFLCFDFAIHNSVVRDGIHAHLP